MSVPPTTQARYNLPTTSHQARKPVFRCLPEIHASRLAVSGSLRPKLGLLLLLVVILVSLCFILIPLLSKISFSSKTHHIPTFPLLDVFEDLSQKSSSSILLSSDLIVSSLAMVSTPTTSLCGVLHQNSSSVRLTGRVFLGRKLGEEKHCPGVEVIEVDFKSKKGNAAVGEWFKKNGVHDIPAIKDSTEDDSTHKAVIATVSDIKLQWAVPIRSSITTGQWISSSGDLKPVKFTVLEGKFRMASLPTHTMVLLDVFKDNLEVYLLLPHSKSDHIGHIAWDDFNLSNYGTSHMEILLPPISLVSSLPLTPSLSTLGKLPPDTQVYQHSSLHIVPTPGISNRTGGDPKRSSISSTRLVFDHNFVIMVREVGTDSALVVGRVS